MDEEPDRRRCPRSTRNRRSRAFRRPASAPGSPIEFTPIASDPDGDGLTFRIANKPAWAHFDNATGRLSGTPQEADVGIFTEIKITVTDGKHSAGLPRFAISVDQISTGSVTLSWYPPTQNADGSPLTDLAGYRVYYGHSADSLHQVITLDNEV